MREQHTVILGIGEKLLIDTILDSLQSIGIRADRGSARPDDLERARAYQAILENIEQARVLRQDWALARLAGAHAMVAA